MNGGHDLGGMHGLEPIDPPESEPWFHAEWERRAFALTLAAGSRGEWNLDKSRFARESMEPGEYLRTSYYEHWLHGLEVLLEEAGHIAPGEIEAKMKAVAELAQSPKSPGFADDRVLLEKNVARTLGRGGSARMDDATPPRFQIGDRIKTVNINPPTHTRLPRYARDKTGVIDIDHGPFIFPDVHANTGTKQAERLYGVRFTALDLWGPDCENPDDVIVLDLFDPYLIAA